MSLLSSFLGRRKPEEVFDPNPGEVHEMPARPYRVLRTDLPFYSDAECRHEVKGARLLVLRCEDPRQKHTIVEYMPVMKTYSTGQIVQWELNNKRLWEAAWHVNTDTGKKEKVWAQSVEFVGRVVKV